MFITHFMFNRLSFNLREMHVEFVIASKTIHFLQTERMFCESDHITPATHHSETSQKQTFWVHLRGRKTKSTKPWCKNPFAVWRQSDVWWSGDMTWNMERNRWKQGVAWRWRWGGEVGEWEGRLRVWLSDITLALINWEYGSNCTSHPTRKAAKETETQEEEATAAAAWRSALLHPLSALWPLTLWTRLICRCICQSWNHFFLWLLSSIFLIKMQAQLACVLLLCFTCGALCTGK